jgi:hypothetical protein
MNEPVRWHSSAKKTAWIRLGSQPACLALELLLCAWNGDCQGRSDSTVTGLVFISTNKGVREIDRHSVELGEGGPRRIASESIPYWARAASGCR